MTSAAVRSGRRFRDVLRSRRLAERRTERERLAETDHLVAVEGLAGRTFADVRRAAVEGAPRRDSEGTR